MESRSGRLRGSNKEDRGRPLFFFAVFAGVVESCAISADRSLSADYRIMVATEQRLSPLAACR